MRILIALVFVVLLASDVKALPRCGSHEDMLAELRDVYQEQLFAVGITERGRLVEITVSPTTGTFTILVTTPPGLSCAVMGGEDWTLVPEYKPGQGT